MSFSVLYVVAGMILLALVLTACSIFAGSFAKYLRFVVYVLVSVSLILLVPFLVSIFMRLF